MHVLKVVILSAMLGNKLWNCFRLDVYTIRKPEVSLEVIFYAHLVD